MIRSRQKECFISIHPLISNEGIFNGDGESMSNVEISGNIGRREANDVFFGVVGLVVGMEKFAE